MDTLRTLRLQRGMSQSVLAERLGADVREVSRWERENKDSPRLPMERVQRLAAGMGYEVTLVISCNGRPVAEVSLVGRE